MIRNEPVRLGAALVGLVGAGMALLTAFGVRITGEQQQAVLAFVEALIFLSVSLGVGEWIRRRVTPIADPKDREGRPLVPQKGE